MVKISLLLFGAVASAKVFKGNNNCDNDSDCVNNPDGKSCIIRYYSKNDPGTKRCGNKAMNALDDYQNSIAPPRFVKDNKLGICKTDKDCVNSSRGPVCKTLPSIHGGLSMCGPKDTNDDERVQLMVNHAASMDLSQNGEQNLSTQDATTQSIGGYSEYDMAWSLASGCAVGLAIGGFAAYKYARRTTYTQMS